MKRAIAKALKKIPNLNLTCFSYNRHDVILLFFFYNLTLLLSLSIAESDLVSCVATAFLVLLITLCVITTIDIFEKEAEEELKLQEEEKELRKNIWDEYQKIYKLKRKQELLFRIEGFHCNMANPSSNSGNDFDSVNKVHFNYLNKFNTDDLPNENPRSSPQGS